MLFQVVASLRAKSSCGLVQYSRISLTNRLCSTGRRVGLQCPHLCGAPGNPTIKIITRTMPTCTYESLATFSLNDQSGSRRSRYICESSCWGWLVLITARIFKWSLFQFNRRERNMYKGITPCDRLFIKTGFPEPTLGYYLLEAPKSIFNFF